MIYDFSANELILACNKLGVDFSEGDFAGYRKAIKSLGKGLILAGGLATAGGVGVKGIYNHVKPGIVRQIDINKATRGLNKANDEITNIKDEVDRLKDGGWRKFDGLTSDDIDAIELNGITDKAQNALNKAENDRKMYETQLKNLGVKPKSNSEYYPTSDKTPRYS